MRHVGLVADHARHADLLEQVHVLAPGLHPAPADLALGEQVFAVILRDLAGLAEGLGDPFGVADRVLLPVGHTAGGVDANAAARADADLAHLPADPAGLLHLIDEALALLGRSHGRAAAGARPDRRHERADLQAIG